MFINNVYLKKYLYYKHDISILYNNAYLNKVIKKTIPQNQRLVGYDIKAITS